LISKGVQRTKISLVANGVDPILFDPAAEGLAAREQFQLHGKFVVLYAGALGMANDLGTLLDAAHLLRDHSDIHFLLAGDGKERLNLEARASHLGLDNVTFTGALAKSRMPEILATADVCVATLKNIPMFTTTYPNKVFDYMAAGRPTVLCIDGVIREVVEAAEGGFFSPPGDAPALATAIQSLYENRRSAREMGLRARQYVERHFHRHRQADHFAELVLRLTEGKFSMPVDTQNDPDINSGTTYLGNPKLLSPVTDEREANASAVSAGTSRERTAV
jgi:glycosyltransferase involved in cell wall biosynthesis